MHVLCIEDDEGLLYLLRKSLEEADFVVSEALDGEHGLQLLQAGDFDAVVIDYELPIMTGLEIIQGTRALHQALPIIMVTGAGNEEIAVEAMQLGADDYLVKDTDLGYLKRLPSVIRRVVYERELAEAQQAAEHALQVEKEHSKILTQFIQDASHEFRTPLTLIQTSCYLLGRISAEPKQQTFIQRIQEQSDAILKLVDHLTNLARLDNTTSLACGPVELRALLNTLVSRKSELIAEKRLQLHLDVPKDDVTVRADANELSDALDELVNNACRYSHPEGTLDIGLHTDQSVATIIIRDTGIGMTDEQVSQVFRRFYRVDEAHSTRGFGLGLPIAARIVDLLQGEITVASELGKGTAVSVSLPLQNGR